MKPNGNGNLIASLAASDDSRNALQRRIAELALGVVSALREGQLTIEDSWDELFNLENYRQIRRRNLSKMLSSLFEYGMELENVAEVSPQSLSESYERIENLARQVIASSAQRRVRRRAG